MKKSIFAAVLFSFAFAAMTAMPSFAQSTQQQAQDIEAAEQAAANADTPSEARNIGNTAWDGTNNSVPGTTSGEGIIDPQNVSGSGNPGDTPQTPTDSDVPEPSESKDVTPWKAEAKALKYLFMGAMLLLAVAAALSDTPNGSVIAVTLSSIAIAASAAAVGLALTIMFKYKQYAYGGMWLAVAGAGLTACAVACIAGAKSFNKSQQTNKSIMGKYVKAILTIIGAGGTFLANTIGNEAENYINKDAAKKYCTENKDHAGCKTSALPYELRDIPAEIDIMDC